MDKAFAFQADLQEKTVSFDRLSDRAASDVRVTRRSHIEWEGEFYPSVGRSQISPAVGVQKPAARQRAHLRAAEALEQRHAPVKIGVSSGFGADHRQL